MQWRENRNKESNDSKSVTHVDPIEFIKRENIVLVNEYTNQFSNEGIVTTK